MDFLLPIWNPFIVNPLTAGLRALSAPLEGYVSPGVAGGLAIILFTILIRLLLLPLSLAQVKSQKAMMALQPELKALQKKFKGDREGMAKAQMALYKDRGVNPMAGCLPLLVQMPILFGMYSAMLNLSTIGLTLDQVQTRQVEPGRVTYAASRTTEPYPRHQFVLATMQVTPKGDGPIALDIPQEGLSVTSQGREILQSTQGLTLTPGQSVSNPNFPNVPNGQAALMLRPGGVRQPDGSLNRGVIVQAGQPYLVELEVYAPQTHVDSARSVVTFDPARLDVTNVETAPLQDVPFKSSFLGLPSLGEPDLIYVFGFGIPGVLLLLMTLTSYITTRMTAVTSDDPQQQAMMKTMAFMPLMYLFFFLQTPAGLVLYWLVSNIFTIGQQYFTTGLGLLRGDLQRITGRDLQPSWAQYGPVPTPRGDDEPSNGRDRDGNDRAAVAAGVNAHHSTLAQGRRPRPAAGKGRKRGKR